MRSSRFGKTSVRSLITNSKAYTRRSAAVIVVTSILVCATAALLATYLVTLLLTTVSTSTIPFDTDEANRLTDPTAHVVAQADAPIGDNIEVTLNIPANIVSGLYTLVAIVYDPDSLAPLPDLAGNFETPLAMLDASGSQE